MSYGQTQDSVKEEKLQYQEVDVKPSFNGGDANQFAVWVAENIVYPEVAKNNGVTGRVVLQFVIEKDGSVNDVKVLRGVDPALDAEAVRVVSMSPKWSPGMEDGKPVRVSFTFPLIFR
jgi:protein TonB